VSVLYKVKVRTFGRLLEKFSSPQVRILLGTEALLGNFGHFEVDDVLLAVCDESSDTREKLQVRKRFIRVRAERSA
jgi:hypothetical protein